MPLTIFFILGLSSNSFSDKPKKRAHYYFSIKDCDNNPTSKNQKIGQCITSFEGTAGNEDWESFSELFERGCLINKPVLPNDMAILCRNSLSRLFIFSESRVRTLLKQHCKAGESHLGNVCEFHNILLKNPIPTDYFFKRLSTGAAIEKSPCRKFTFRDDPARCIAFLKEDIAKGNWTIFLDALKKHCSAVWDPNSGIPGFCNVAALGYAQDANKMRAFMNDHCGPFPLQNGLCEYHHAVEERYARATESPKEKTIKKDSKIEANARSLVGTISSFQRYYHDENLVYADSLSDMQIPPQQSGFYFGLLPNCNNRKSPAFDSLQIQSAPQNIEETKKIKAKLKSYFSGSNGCHWKEKGFVAFVAYFNSENKISVFTIDNDKVLSGPTTY